MKPQNLSEAPRKQALRMQLAQQLTGNTTKVLKKPMYVVRPAPMVPPPSLAMSNAALDKRCILSVFKHLGPRDLYRCAMVCKVWAQYTIDPVLWKKMGFAHKRISSEHLKGIVRRQPESLNLDWAHINK